MSHHHGNPSTTSTLHHVLVWYYHLSPPACHLVLFTTRAMQQQQQSTTDAVLVNTNNLNNKYLHKWLTAVCTGNNIFLSYCVHKSKLGTFRSPLNEHQIFEFQEVSLYPPSVLTAQVAKCAAPSCLMRRLTASFQSPFCCNWILSKDAFYTVIDWLKGCDSTHKVLILAFLSVCPFIFLCFLDWSKVFQKSEVILY